MTSSNFILGTNIKTNEEVAIKLVSWVILRNLWEQSILNCFMRPNYTGFCKEELEFQMSIGLASKEIITLWSLISLAHPLRIFSTIANENSVSNQYSCSLIKWFRELSMSIQDISFTEILNLTISWLELVRNNTMCT